MHHELLEVELVETGDVLGEGDVIGGVVVVDNDGEFALVDLVLVDAGNEVDVKGEEVLVVLDMADEDDDLLGG